MSSCLKPAIIPKYATYGYTTKNHRSLYDSDHCTLVVCVCLLQTDQKTRPKVTVGDVISQRRRHKFLRCFVITLLSPSSSSLSSSLINQSRWAYRTHYIERVTPTFSTNPSHRRKLVPITDRFGQRLSLLIKTTRAVV